MSNEFWDEEEISEYDLIEEDAKLNEEVAAEIDSTGYTYDVEDLAPEVLEEIEDDSAFELEDEEVAVIYDARLRLEQARLYEMLINHDVFEGVDASPHAIKNVQNELKDYILERLEILLGMQQEKSKEPEQIIQQVESPFNDIEVDFLKQLAYKGTKGDSATGQPLPVLSSEPKPLAAIKKPKKLKGLKTLTSRKKLKPASEAVPVKKTPVRRKVVKKQVVDEPLPVKPTKKVRKKRAAPKKGPKIESGPVNRRNLTPGEIEQLAQEEIAADKRRKPFAKMTAAEKAKEVVKVNEKHARSTHAGETPMLDNEKQLEVHYMNQQLKNGRTAEDVMGGMVKNIYKKMSQSGGKR